MTTFRPLLPAAAAAALSAAAPVFAQYTWPPAYAAAAGNAVMNAPFTVGAAQPTGSTRCMVVIDAASLPFPPGTLLTQLKLRRDTTYRNQAYAGATGTLTVRLGRATAAPDQVCDVRFARLWDGIPTVVYKNVPQTPFVLPAAPAPGAAVPPFQIVIPFQTNFTYQGGPLAVEFLWTPIGGSSAFRIDAFAAGVEHRGVSQLVGPGCAGSNGFTPFHYALPETTMPGAALAFQVEGGRLPPSPGALENFAVHTLGLQAANWQGLPLPVSLGAFGGPPACLLRIDPLLLDFVPTVPSALFTRAADAVALPGNPALVGVTIYSQWLLFDGGLAAPLQVAVSDALAVTLGQVAPLPAAPRARTLWKYGANGFDNDSGKLVTADYGPVLQFQ